MFLGSYPDPREPDRDLQLHHVPGQVQRRRRVHCLPAPGPRAGAAVRVHHDDVWHPRRVFFT